MVLTVLYILKDAEGTTIGAELRHNGKPINSKTEELKRKRRGISFTNATLDADGFLHAKDENKPLREKVVGGVGTSSFKPVKSRPTSVSVKIK